MRQRSPEMSLVCDEKFVKSCGQVIQNATQQENVQFISIRWCHTTAKNHATIKFNFTQ